MEAISIYPVITADFCSINNKNDKQVIHALKVPRSNSKSLCGINFTDNNEKWTSIRKEITCEECLAKIKQRRYNLHYFSENESFVEKIEVVYND